MKYIFNIEFVFIAWIAVSVLMGGETESLEDFFNRLCISLSLHFRGSYQKVLLYGAPIQILEKIKLEFIKGLGERDLNIPPEIFLRENYNIKDISEDTYYVDLGQFLRMYENRKAKGLNVIFEDSWY